MLCEESGMATYYNYYLLYAFEHSRNKQNVVSILRDKFWKKASFENTKS